ncbi:MAG: hypothetical protein Q8L68_05255 [Methylococcales bacterium]|nr:hypothetical protein [Methylococcales bacterium]
MMSRTLPLNIAFWLLFVSLLPVVFVLDTVAVEHFFSSQHLFEYAFDHAFRFGQDLIDNVGPYGYLHYPYTYAGGAFWSKMLWFGCILAIYAYYAAQLSLRISNPYHKLLFLGTLSLFPLQIDCHWYGYEVLPRLAVLFSALYFLDPLSKYITNSTARGVGYDVTK